MFPPKFKHLFSFFKRIRNKIAIHRFQHQVAKHFPPRGFTTSMHFRDSNYIILFNGIFFHKHVIILHSMQPIIYPKTENELYIFTHTAQGTAIVHAFDVYGICRTYKHLKNIKYTLLPYTSKLYPVSPEILLDHHIQTMQICPKPFVYALFQPYEKSALIIQRRWRRCISNPYHPLCQKRLLHEFKELTSPPPPY